MTQGKILALNTCEDLQAGYYYFEDILSMDILEFNNYRKVTFDADFQALKDSINDHGIKVPVQISYDTTKKKFLVLAGERRIRAVEQLKMEAPDKITTLPTLVLVCDQRADVTDLDLTVTSVVSNLMSKGLSQVDKMRCYKKLADKGMTKKEISRCCGKDRKTVERSLQLAQFDDEALTFIESSEKSGLLKARNVEIIGQKLKNA
jgi:ParB/RepB/Spo0J family partition protein